MPVRQLAAELEPRLPDAALRSAESLRYRDFVTVGLILRERNRFNDNWIYIHDPNVKVGRVQNYKSLVAGNGSGPGLLLLWVGIFLF